MNNNECPICMDTIEENGNRVVTECGHVFHCSCLMKNASHNGFGCPCCRTKMAEELADDDESIDSDDSIEEGNDFNDNVLTSFRMFHQQINNEEVEEEPEEEDDEDFWESVNNDDDEEEIPDATYVTQKLIERGITMEDLVKNILFQEHSDWGEKYSDYERRSSEIFGQFRAIISRYTPPNALNNNPVNNNPIMPDIVPHVHEEKENKMLKRREFMTHV